MGPRSQLVLCDADFHLRHPGLLQETSRLFYFYKSPDAQKIGEIRGLASADAMRRYGGECETFFWQERDPSGGDKVLDLRRIVVISHEGIVHGFRFVYDGGLTKSFGSNLHDRLVVDLNPSVDEKLCRLVVYYITDGRYALEVRLFRHRLARLSRPHQYSESLLIRASLNAAAHNKRQNLPRVPQTRDF